MDALFATYRPVRGDETAMFVTDAFNVEDVMVNSIFADGLRDLGILAGEAGDRAAAREYISAAERTEAALLNKCWNAGAAAFWDLDGAAETPARVLTVTSLFPHHPDTGEPGGAQGFGWSTLVVDM